MLLRPASHSFPARAAPLHLGRLVERCIASFRGWYPAGLPGLHCSVHPVLALERIGDEHLAGLILLQQLHAGIGASTKDALQLQVQPSPLPGLDLRFSLGPIAPATDPAPTGSPDEVPASAPAFAMAVLRALVDIHGGALALDTLASGERCLNCDLVLPAAPPSAEPTGSAHAAPGSPQAPQPPLQVLLVEDHPVNAEMTIDMLQLSGGIQVVHAKSGEEASRQALQQVFDVVLMDLFLPDSDGVVVARRIARMLGAAAPPVIALTASAYPAERELCLQAGMVDVLVKPIAVTPLVAAVRRWGAWQRRRLWRAQGSD